MRGARVKGGGKEEGMCRKEKKCMGEGKRISGQSAGEIQRLTDS